MNNYIVYEKKKCNCPYADIKNYPAEDWVRDRYGLCVACKATGITFKEVPLEDAVIDLLLTNPLFRVRVSNLTWTI